MKRKIVIDPQSYRTKKRLSVIKPEVISRGLVSIKRRGLGDTFVSGRTSGMTERLQESSPYRFD